MKTAGQTSKHLLLAAIVTVFSVMLILITLTMKWEPWIVPLIAAGMFSVWFLHIGRNGSEIFYEHLCAGLMLGEFFFFGVHRGIIFDIPAVACIMILIFSLFDRKRLLYMTVALYVLEMLYHVLILHSIAVHPGNRAAVRLLLGAAVVIGAAEIARYRINKRMETRKMHENTFAELETAGKQNAIFLSNVSHELRTPINMVVGISEVLQDKAVSPEVREDIRSIRQAGRRLSNLINNMLDYTEIVEGTLSPAKEEYRFTSVLNDVLTITAVQNSRSQLEIVFDVDPKLPAVLIGDAEKISHVLKILVENSIKFTEEGGINVCVEFREESYGVNLVIDIFDTGIGMTDSQITRMYDDFYQADSGSSRLAGGLGLGLPIARGLLHAMGGFIYFDGKGEGLQAHITIPQGVADDAPCMELAHADQLCIACFFRPERYSSDDIRLYYDRLIRHMMEGLGIEGYQAHNFEGLLKLQRTYKLTHVFIAETEYKENSNYYEELAGKLRVVVIAERSFVLNQGSRLLVIRKPFSALSVVNLLNGEIHENGFKEAQVAGRRPFSCEGVKVLAVDDEEMNLVVAKGVLGGYGIQVDTCLSGREAIELCGRTPYDVVFLDHMMPGFDGVETLKRIRELNNGMYRELPVIALTANTISGAREMFRNEGFSEFIPKPIERAVLERVLRKVLPENSIHYSTVPINQDEQVSGAGIGVSYMARKMAESAVLHDAGRYVKTAVPYKSGEKVKTYVPEESVERVKASVEDMAEEAITHEAGITMETPESDTGKRNSEASVPEGIAEETEAVTAFVSEAPPEDNDDSFTVRGGKETPPEDIMDYDGSPGGGQTNEVPMTYAQLKRAGVNVKTGLDYCCGDEEFYMEMLQMFQTQSADKRAEINSLYEAANWADYAVKVHALKSTSLTIGAERLSAYAKLLEHAGKKEDVKYIRKNHAEFLRMYDEVCESIAKL